MFTLEVVSTLSRLEELGPEWDRLADTAGSPLLGHAWFVEAARAFAAEGRLSIHIARDAGGARAIAPLAMRRIGGAWRLQMLGCEHYEPEAFLWDDEDALAEVCASVLRLKRPLLLFRLLDEGPELALLRKAPRSVGVRLVRWSCSQAYANPISPDWAALEAAMNIKQRNELRRRRKKLEELWPLTFEALAPDERDFLQPLEAFLKVEGAGWKRQGGTALLQRPEDQGFFRNYARRAALRGQLRLFFLRLDGRVVAGQLHIQAGGRLWALKIGYDEAYAQYSPGALLTHEVLRYGCEQGLRAFEHLGLAEHWQRRWAVETRSYSSLRIYPFSLPGARTFGLDALGMLRAKSARLGRPWASAPPARPGPAAALAGAQAA